MTIGLLVAPHANARYFRSIRDLSLAEFMVMNGVIRAEDVEYRSIGGLELLCCSIDDANMESALRALCRHSSCQAIFAVEGELLRPLPIKDGYHLSGDISAIQKYKGKTNERFTSLLINIAVFSGAFADRYTDRLSLLDPMCGRGTTLLEGLRRGYHVSGIEIDKADEKEANHFLQHYLQYHKIKHTMKRSSMTVQGKPAAERILGSVGDGQSYTYIRGDTRDAGTFFRKSSFEAMVVDLPYGVQHRSLTGKNRAQTDALMRDALPGWKNLLKPGAAIALSFNAHTIKMETLRGMLGDAGLLPLEGGAYDGMRHWVEQAVDRDVAVAVYPQ